MKEFKKNLKYVKPYFKGHGLRMFFILLTTLVILALRIISPIISAKVIVHLTSNEFEQVILIALVLWGIDLFWMLNGYLQRQLYQKIYTEVFINVQSDLGSAILRLNNTTLDDNSSGVFIQRLTNDTSTIADAFNTFISNLTQFFSAFGTLVAIYVVSVPAGLYATVAIAISIVLSNIRVNIKNREQKELKKLNEKTTGFIGEIVRGAKDIKMLNSEKSFLKELKVKVGHNQNEGFRVRTKDRRLNYLERIVNNTFWELFIIFLVHLIMTGKLTITNALIIHNYQGRASQLTSAIAYLLESFKDFNLSCTRIFDILGSDEFKKEEFGTTHLDSIEGNFEFRNVTFSYKRKHKVLKDLSFKVDANTTVGFVGKSGEGKTTIFSLLCKMYDVHKGEILIDGININKLDKDSIRGNITVISQNPYIFNLSIKDNLKLVKEDITMKEIREACKMACLDEFIESLPDKYNTILGEGGVNLSGGQRQRLAIARAFVQKTEIILFDEATSALDNETQMNIQQAIRNLKKDYTILIIAHRLSTIKDCDKILLISDGQVEAEGTHEELMKKSKSYKELYESEIEK